MMKYLFYGFMLATMLTIASCIKDKGNYNYHAINQVTFNNLDTVNGYQVGYGDTLKLNPTLNLSQDKNGTGSYIYAWSWALTNKFGDAVDSIITTSKNLSSVVKLVPGIYTLQYRVKDNGTGVTFQTRVKVNVTTDVYEGYMLLSNVGGQSRLDMLSYKSTTNSFTKYIDVLKKMGSTVPMNGMPYQVYCTQYTTSDVTPEDYGIFIFNSAGGNRIDQETFAYDPIDNIRNLFVGNVPKNFAPVHIFQEGAFGLAYPIMYTFDGGGNVYGYSIFAGSAFHYSPLNTYTATGTPFHVAPYGVSDGSTGIFYNSDKKGFVTAPSYSSTFLVDAGASLKYPTGYNMVFMDKDYNNNAFAILQDPATSNMYLLRFPIGGVATYFQQIIGTDISSANNFAVSPTFGYLFYSVGGKVYEYDPSLQTSILMVDKGSSTITSMSFQHFFNSTTSTVNQKYSTWANYLSVASYGSSSTSGTFELYSVPPINEQIVKVNGWTGFGQIVSVSYRER